MVTFVQKTYTVSGDRAHEQLELPMMAFSISLHSENSKVDLDRQHAKYEWWYAVNRREVAQ